MAYQISVSPVQSDGKCSSYVVSAAGTDKTFKCGKGGASGAYNRAYAFAKRIVKGFIEHEHAFAFVAYRPDSSLETSFSWSKSEGIHDEKTGEKGVTAVAKRRTAAKKKTTKSTTSKLVASAKAKIASLTDKLTAAVSGKTPKKKTAKKKTAKKTGTKKTAPATSAALVPFKAAASKVAKKRKAAKKSPKAVAANKAVARSSTKAPVPAGVGGLPSAASLASMKAKPARSAAKPKAKAKAKTAKRKSSK